MKKADLIRLSTTAVIVLVAVLVAWLAWQYYMLSPWTSDARVRAEIIKVAPDISGRVTDVRVRDNQLVAPGDVLYVIDPERYQLALMQARSDRDLATAKVTMAQADVNAAAANAKAASVDHSMLKSRAQRRVEMGDAISSEERIDSQASAQMAAANVARAQAQEQAAQATLQQAIALAAQAEVAVANAQLNLDRTQVLAPAAGTVTNLDVRVGDYAEAGHAQMALVVKDSFWIYGYFEETKLPAIYVGAPVDIYLMAGGAQFTGRVESIASGIADAASPTSGNLLADVQPTFNWIRLAQRIPVRVAIDVDSVPAGVALAAGMSATLRLR